MPKDICATPNITAIFILKLFMKVNTLFPRNQVGSTPIGCTQSFFSVVIASPPVTVILKQVVISTGMAMKSLYQIPAKIENMDISNIKYLAWTKAPTKESLSFSAPKHRKTANHKRRNP